MGKLGLAVDLFEYTARFVKASGKKTVLATKPQNIRRLDISGLKFATPIKSDICTFTKDPTLAPELLDDLLKVKGSQTEKALQIRDRFLKALGYKHPELIKFDDSPGRALLSVDFFDGAFFVSPAVEVPIKQLIPGIRHEVDHIDKFAKLVKAVGIDNVEKAFLKSIPVSASKTKKFDRSFWLKMSEDADITNFDAKKYLSALENYSYDLFNAPVTSSRYEYFTRLHKYCNNELEKSAYQCQKKLLRYYCENDIIITDFMSDSFVKIKKLLESYIEKNKSEPIPNFSGESTFDVLSDISIGMADPKGVKALKYIKDAVNGKIESNQAKLIEQVKVLQDVNSKFTPKDQADYFERIYQWLKEGKFTLNDFDFG